MTTITLPSTIPASGTITIKVAGLLGYGNCAYLTSTNASRAINWSIDGTNFYKSNYDGSITAQLASFLTGQVSHLQFVGSSGDAFGITGLNGQVVPKL